MNVPIQQFNKRTTAVLLSSFSYRRKLFALPQQWDVVYQRQKDFHSEKIHAIPESSTTVFFRIVVYLLSWTAKVSLLNRKKIKKQQRPYFFCSFSALNSNKMSSGTMRLQSIQSLFSYRPQSNEIHVSIWNYSKCGWNINNWHCFIPGWKFKTQHKNKSIVQLLCNLNR